MSLTTAQQAALKAYVEADPTLSQFPHTGDGAYALADALKAVASPEFVVWKTRASPYGAAHVFVVVVAILAIALGVALII